MKTPKIEQRQIEQKKRLVELLKKNPIVEVVCQQVGIGRATYYRWLAEDETFAHDTYRAESEGRGKLNDFMESKLISLAREGNIAAVIFYLKHNHNRYAENLTALSDETMRVILQAMETIATDPEQEQRLLSQLIERRVPLRLGSFLIQLAKLRSSQQTKQQEQKKLELIDKATRTGYT
jgi:hypothetical protein